MYLPFNDGSTESHNDFLIFLGKLEGFIDQHKFDHRIARDFNVYSDHDSVNLQHLCKVMAELSLGAANLPFHSSIRCTYVRDDSGVSSWSDHYLCDPSLACELLLFHHLDFVPTYLIILHYFSLRVDLSLYSSLSSLSLSSSASSCSSNTRIDCNV